MKVVLIFGKSTRIFEWILGNTNSEQIFRTIVDNIDQLGSRLSDFADKGLQIILGTVGFCLRICPYPFCLLFFSCRRSKKYGRIFPIAISGSSPSVSYGETSSRPDQDWGMGARTDYALLYYWHYCLYFSSNNWR